MSDEKSKGGASSSALRTGVIRADDPAFEERTITVTVPKDAGKIIGSAVVFLVENERGLSGMVELPQDDTIGKIVLVALHLTIAQAESRMEARAKAARDLVDDARARRN